MDRYEPQSQPDSDGSLAAEARHFELCGRCGQYVDRRDSQQVNHHRRLSHRALRLDSE